MTKPAELDRFLDVVRQVGDFFLTVVRLPDPRLTGRGRTRPRPTAR